jgi:hypothetical protein
MGQAGVMSSGVLPLQEVKLSIGSSATVIYRIREFNLILSNGANTKGVTSVGKMIHDQITSQPP